MPNRRFFRWFRTIPLMAVAIVGIVSALYTMAPSALLRNVLFPVHHREAIMDSCNRHGVDPRLVCAVITCESRWNDNARSSVGAVGLMQVMPETAETLILQGYTDADAYDWGNLSDPATNIECGTACLKYLQDNLESTDQVIAAYNAGIGTVQGWLDGEPDISSAITYPETKVYLVKVSEAYEIYQQLYDEQLMPR